MSGSLNKTQLIGNVCKEPEIRFTADNDAIANVSLATNESYKKKNGEKVNKAEFHRVVIFGGIAEVVEKYVHKGDSIFIEGKLVTRKWQDKQGQDKYTTEIVVDSFSGKMLMLGSKSDYKQQSCVAEAQDDAYDETPPF